MCVIYNMYIYVCVCAVYNVYGYTYICYGREGPRRTATDGRGAAMEEGESGRGRGWSGRAAALFFFAKTEQNRGGRGEGKRKRWREKMRRKERGTDLSLAGRGWRWRRSSGGVWQLIREGEGAAAAFHCLLSSEIKNCCCLLLVIGCRSKGDGRRRISLSEGERRQSDERERGNP